MLLHCGPAIDWSDVFDPLRRSMRAATVSEGWAETVEEADRMLADGRVMLEPGYQHDTVLPMASAIGTRGDYRGTPLSVEVRRVVELNTTPKVTTGILPREFRCRPDRCRGGGCADRMLPGCCAQPGGVMRIELGGGGWLSGAYVHAGTVGCGR
jgi:hypothetical protein